ncbi:MAG: methyltransferase domain-containing protein [Planctomycetia bacterium]
MSGAPPTGPAGERPRAAAGWEQRYRAGDTPWDLGSEPPILRAELARLGPGAGRPALVPGAGYGHDALALARAGWQVTAVDIAPSACARLRARAREEGLSLEVLEADLLDLPAALDGRFALAWEQTCLCALEPAQRAACVAALARVLQPGALLLALLWNHGQPGGPPHDLPPEVVRPLYAPWFEEQAQVAVVPAPGARRVGEYLLRLVRRG